MKAIVYPILTGYDWSEPAPPLPLERDSKIAAIRALRDNGYRIMWRGGLQGALTVTAKELRNSKAGSPEVIQRTRALGYELDDDAEITQYVITVWPKN